MQLTQDLRLQMILVIAKAITDLVVHATRVLVEGLELAKDGSHHNITILGRYCPIDYYNVILQNSCILHGITCDFKQEHRSPALPQHVAI